MIRSKNSRYVFVIAQIIEVETLVSNFHFFISHIQAQIPNANQQIGKNTPAAIFCFFSQKIRGITLAN